MVPNRSPSRWMTDDVEAFRHSVRRLIAREFEPHFDRWIAQGCVDRDAWRVAGDAGLLCVSAPEAYGGGGGSFAHEAVIAEELEYAGIGLGFGLSLHSAIVAPYFTEYGTEDQRRRWLPKLASGEAVAAIAMTEPGTGSDLQGITTRARRQGDDYVVSGQKTFITNGQLADLVLTVCTTDPQLRGKGLALLAVDAGSPGFRRGRNLDKIGLEASDTSELFFDDVPVPARDLLGAAEGRGFGQLMAKLVQERLVLAVSAVAAIERAVALTLDHVRTRRAFGKALLEFQNTQFVLAECRTEQAVARAFLDACVERHLAGELDAAGASMAKLWCTERQGRIIDRCLQLFGGHGYMAEMPIGRMYVDARVQRLYGGTSEIMKMLIAREL